MDKEIVRRVSVCCAAPPTWVHPDLRRLIAAQETAQEATDARMTTSPAGGEEEMLHQRYVYLTQRKRDREVQKSHAERLVKRLKKEIRGLNNDIQAVSKLSGELKRQRSCQQSLGVLGNPTTSSHLSTSLVNTFRPLSSLDVHFAHLYRAVDLWPVWTPSQLARMEAEETSRGGEEYNGREWQLDGNHVREKEEDHFSHRTIDTFLKMWFPVLQFNRQAGVVEPPVFEPQLCQTEREALVRQPENGCCTLSSCLYWHKNQLEHLKRVTAERLSTLRSTYCSSDSRLCVVSQFLHSELHQLLTSQVLHHFCCRLVFLASHLIYSGWPLFLIHSSSSLAWPVPLHPNSETEVAWWDLLRDNTEKNVWESVLASARNCSRAAEEKMASDNPQRFYSRLRNTDRGISWNYLQESTIDLFQKCPSAVGWRFLLRCIASSHPWLSLVQRRWLEEQGFRLFRSSPHLATGYVLSLTEGSDWDPAHVLHQVTEVATVLSAQCCGATYVRGEMEEDGTEGITEDVRYEMTTARYIAYFLAVTAVRVAEREGDNGCPLTLQFLTMTAEPGHFFLLPIALHNFSLLAAAVLQHGNLLGVLHMPLGSISDVALMLSDYKSGAGPHGRWVTVLHQQLQFLNRYAAEGLDATLIDSLRSSTQLSLLRSLHVEVEVVEQIMMKSAMTGEVMQATISNEWLSLAARHDEQHGVRTAVAELLHAKTNHLVHLVLQWRLGEDAETVADHSPSSASGLAEESNSEGPETSLVHRCCLDDVAAAVEMAHGMGDEEAEVKFLLQRISDERFCHDPNAVLLLLVVLVRLAGRAVRHDWFISALQEAITALQEQQLTWWSPLDTFADNVIAFPHYVTLLIYQLVPALLCQHGRGKVTERWRRTVLHIGSDFGVLHPLLLAAETCEERAE